MMARKPNEQVDEELEQRAADSPNVKDITPEWILNASDYDWREVFGSHVEVVYHPCLDGNIGFERVNDNVIRVWK
jgi:hypothetical protein